MAEIQSFLANIYWILLRIYRTLLQKHLEFLTFVHNCKAELFHPRARLGFETHSLFLKKMYAFVKLYVLHLAKLYVVHLTTTCACRVRRETEGGEGGEREREMERTNERKRERVGE